MTHEADEVSIRELRNHAGEVVDRVMRGERVIITRSKQPVAELSPLPIGPSPATDLIERCRHLPHVDPEQLRTDIDAVIGAPR